jgi:hypothetical protein
MQVFGLRHELRPAIDYLTLERALKVGKGKEFRVEEVSEGGSVTELKLLNGLDSPVLLVEGEILLGAKQNRTVYTTILVDKKSNITIPVACVEQGRWSRMPAARFALSDLYAHSSLRYAKLNFVARARAAFGARGTRDSRGAYPVDQGGVWNKVQMFQTSSAAQSPTGSADEAYRTFKQRSGEPIEFTCPRDCSGIAVAIDGRLAGVECFDRPDTMEKVFPRLIQSYITEAMLRKVVSGKGVGAGRTEAEQDKPLASDKVVSFLRDVAGAKVTSAPGIGMGEDLRAQASAWSAAVLTYKDRGLHGQVLLGGVGGTAVADRHIIMTVAAQHSHEDATDPVGLCLYELASGAGQLQRRCPSSRPRHHL